MNNNIVPSIILGIALVLASIFAGRALVNSKLADRNVTVKGLSEKTVVADKAWWSIHSTYGENSIEAIQQRIKSHENTVRSFLNSQGFTEDEIKVDNINVYQNQFRDATKPYSVDIRISVTSTDVDKIEKASSKSSELIQDGVLLSGDKWSDGPKYYFTAFNDVKTDMLAESTQQALIAAQEFANNSKSEVGKIRNANQGVFTIVPGNRTNDNEELYKDKLIRVVSTVSYYLD